MKGIHHNQKLTVGNVETQKTVFQAAKQKKSSLAKAAEDSLKFQKMVEESQKKVVRKPGEQKSGTNGRNQESKGKPESDSPMMAEDEEDYSSPPPATRFDIRI